MRLISRTPLLLACLAAGCATASMSPDSAPMGRALAPRPTSGAILPADLMTRLYIFADDSMLGRESGQLGNVRGTNYIAREMQRMGLRPGGENGTFFQTVPATMSQFDSTSALTVNGSVLRYGVDVLPLNPATTNSGLPMGSASRSLDGLRAIYGGQLGGTMISPSDAAGRLVVFTLPADSIGQHEWRWYRKHSLEAYGAAGAIAVAGLDITPAASIRSLRGAIVHLPLEGTGAYPLGLQVSTSAAQRMLGVSTLDGLRVGTGGATLSGTTSFTDRPTPYPARNVIGILPGSDPAVAGQYVAIGAHNDHIGIERHPLEHDSVLAFNMVLRRQGVQDAIKRPTPEQWSRILQLRDSLRASHGGIRPDSINNGADDDGSGTVAMLEIAERFATAPARPRRSLLFVSHTGEEKGLWGSQWFTDHPTVSRDSITAQLNMDMVGRGKDSDIMGRGPNNVQLIGPSRLSSQLGALIDSVNAVRTPRMDIDYQFDANGHPLNRYCRSDHYMYARYGIPITYFSLGYHTDYHQVSDEPQYIDYEHMARIATFVHDIAETVANRPQRLVVDGVRLDPKGGCRQ